MLYEKNFTIVDVETTGGSPFFSRIIKIGLLRVEKGEVVEEYQTLLNPQNQELCFTGLQNRSIFSTNKLLDSGHFWDIM